MSENCTKEFYTIGSRLYNRNHQHQHFLFSCHRPVVPGTSPEPTAILTTQAASFTLQYFPYMCDVPSTAVFCSEPIECFPGTALKCFFQTFVTVPVASVITGYYHNLLFHFRCKSFTFFLVCVLLRHIPVHCYLHIHQYAFLGFFLSLIGQKFSHLYRLIPQHFCIFIFTSCR
jgi:hypothetical protein